MKLEVWTEPEPELKPKEPIRLRLLQDGPGRADLCVVDAKGNRVQYGTIASLTGKGLMRCSCLSRDFGFPQDREDRILDV